MDDFKRHFKTKPNCGLCMIRKAYKGTVSEVCSSCDIIDYNKIISKLVQNKKLQIVISYSDLLLSKLSFKRSGYEIIHILFP